MINHRSNYVTYTRNDFERECEAEIKVFKAYTGRSNSYLQSYGRNLKEKGIRMMNRMVNYVDHIYPEQHPRTGYGCPAGKMFHIIGQSLYELQRIIHIEKEGIKIHEKRARIRENFRKENPTSSCMDNILIQNRCHIEYLTGKMHFDREITEYSSCTQCIEPICKNNLKCIERLTLLVRARENETSCTVSSDIAAKILEPAYKKQE